MSEEISQIEKGKRAFAKHQLLIKLKKNLNLGFLALGKLLSDLRESGDYKRILGDDIGEKKGAWNYYLLQPEVSIAPSTSRGLILVYKKWIVELGFTEEQIQAVDRRKLQALIPLVQKENAEDWLAKARTLSRGGLFKEIGQDGMTLGEAQECEHELSEGRFFKCRKCGEVFYVNPPAKYKSIEPYKKQEKV